MQSELAIHTGGASGIGRASGAGLARRGARLAVADLNAAAAQLLAEKVRTADGQASAAGAARILFASGAT